MNAIGPGVVVTQNTRRLMADPVMRERMDASMHRPSRLFRYARTKKSKGWGIQGVGGESKGWGKGGWVMKGGRRDE